MSNRQPNFTPKASGERRRKNLRNQQKEINHKDQTGYKFKKINEGDNSKDQ